MTTRTKVDKTFTDGRILMRLNLKQRLCLKPQSLAAIKKNLFNHKQPTSNSEL